MAKTYTELREQTELNELSVVRAGSTLLFASKVREAGKRLENKIGNAKGRFNAAKSAKKPEDKLDLMMDGMTDIADAIYLQRVMMGNITGLSLSAALTQERSDKNMTKLMKGKHTR